MEPPVLVSPPDRYPMTVALVGLLAAVTGVPWEIGRIPTKTKADPERPSRTISVSVDGEYGILYPQWTTIDGPARKPNVTWNYQATMVVKRADQLEVFDHKIQAAIIGRTADMGFAYPLDVDGLNIIDRILGTSNTGGNDAPTDVRTELPTRDIRFAITVNSL